MKSLRNDQISPILGLQLRDFDLNTRDEKGTPPLVVALANDSFKVADYLIQQPGLDLDATNASGENALMMAALKGQSGIVRALLARGAQVNKPDWAPLHYAATLATPESEQMVKLLLDKYAYIDAASPNQTTPLMMAARYGSGKVVRLLLTEGADAALKNDKGMTAIDFANSVSRKDIAELIHQHMVRATQVVAPVPKAIETVAAPAIEAAPVPETVPAPETMPVRMPAVHESPLDAKAGAEPVVVAPAAAAPDAVAIVPESARVEPVAEPEHQPAAVPEPEAVPATTEALPVPNGW